MSFTMYGIGVSGGIAIGYAHLISHVALEVAHYTVPKYQVAEESARFDAAVTTARAEITTLRASIPANAPAEFSAFLDLHQMILDDVTLSKVPREIIEQQECNAEWALKLQMDSLLAQFDEIDDAYMAERKHDVIQVVERLLKALTGQPGYIPAPASGEEGSILVAHDLSPADVIQFKTHQFASFITDVGGATSHTAIIARSLGIPSIVALHHARQLLRENDLLVVDGTHGCVIVNPDPQVLSEYRERQAEWLAEKRRLKPLKTTRAATKCGMPVDLHANIELPSDVDAVKENGGTGIGLFRSEFLFLNRDELPGEDEQFEAYRKVAQDMHGMPVIIRTLDIGADKQINAAERVATNPALGLRAIRYCLAEPHIFHTQLRAILRASNYGKVKLLLPMLSTTAELRQAMMAIDHAKRSLDDEDIWYDRAIEVGGMIEIPAAALAIDMFAKKLAFLSIGTNDLIQYTLAIDRTDDSVAHLYDPLHPAVLRLVAMVIERADAAQVPVSVCGEMAGDDALTRLLLGFGLRRFSMHPANLLAVKQRVLKSEIEPVRDITRQMLACDEPDQIHELLSKLNA